MKTFAPPKMSCENSTLFRIAKEASRADLPTSSETRRQLKNAPHKLWIWSPRCSRASVMIFMIAWSLAAMDGKTSQAADGQVRQIERAVFMALPLASYDVSLIEDAFESATKLQLTDFGTARPDAARIRQISASRKAWIEKIRPNLEREYQAEHERLKRTGGDMNPVQSDLYSNIFEVAVIPDEFALDGTCDKLKVTWGSARDEIADWELQSKANANVSRDTSYAIIAAPIWAEISVKGGHVASSPDDANIRYTVLRRAVFFHAARIRDDKSLTKILATIAQREHGANWVGAETKKVVQEFPRIRRLRRDFLNQVIAALGLGSGSREFELPKDVWVTGNTSNLAGRAFYSPADLSRLKIELALLDAPFDSPQAESLRELVVRQIGSKIASVCRETVGDVRRLTLANRIRLTGNREASGRDIVEWTVYLEGCEGRLARVNRVVYHLHSTFQPNTIEVRRQTDNQDFHLSRTGWGRFSLKADVFYDDGTKETLEHWLQW